MIDEKKPFINPQAEGSNVASGSKQKGKERSSETEGNFVSNSNQELTKLLSNLPLEYRSCLLDKSKLNTQESKWTKEGEDRNRAKYCFLCNKQLVRYEVQWTKIKGRRVRVEGNVDYTSEYTFRGKVLCGGCVPWFKNQGTEAKINLKIEKAEKEYLLSLVKKSEGERTKINQTIKRAVEMWEEIKTELENENQELKKQINKAIAEHKKKEEEQKEREKKEKEQEAEIKKRKGEIQKALQSAEKMEIEKLREESQKANRTAEQLAEDLKAWIKAYEEKALGEQLAIAGMEEIFSVVKQRNSQLTIIENQHTALLADNEGLKEAKKNLETSLADIKTKRDEWEQKHNTLELQISDYREAKEKAEKEKKEAISQAEKDKEAAEEKLASLGYPKWFDRTTTFLGMENVNQIWGKGVFIGRFALIILVGAILLYIASWILRILVGIFKNLKAIFTKKQNTAEVLKDLLTGMKEAKDSIRKKQENQPVAVSKEEVKPEKILPQISSEKENKRKGRKNRSKKKKSKR